MKIAHLSDLHFTSNPQDFSLLRSDLSDALTAVVDDLNKIEEHLDCISITGDLTEAGDIESYRGVKDLLSGFSVPIYVIPGNHDLRDPFREVFGSSNLIAGSDTVDYATRFEAVQILGFDTLIEGKPAGRLSETQLACLESRLNSEEFRHTVISLHHPPFPTKQTEFDAMGLHDGRDELAALVENANSEIILLCGHVHRPYQAIWKGASCYISGGPSFQMGSAFCFGASKLNVLEEPYAYFIHSIDDDDHVVGTRYVNLSGSQEGARL